MPHRAPQAHSAACPSTLSATQCSALSTAFANYQTAASAANTVAGYLAEGANKVTGAVAANSPGSAFFQTAYAKVNAGALAVDLAYEQQYGQALANLLSSDGLSETLGAGRSKKLLRRLPQQLLSGHLRKAFMSQLSAVRGSLSSATLASPIDYSGYLRAYESISLSDLAAIVYGAYRNGHFSASVEQTLTGDLQNAQSVCSNPSQRIDAMKQFVSDSSQAGDDAHFLTFGAGPLLVQNAPASACN